MRMLLWTLSKITGSSTTRPTSTLRTRPVRNACGRGSAAAERCLWKCVALCLNSKGLPMENSPSASLTRLPMTERQLDSELKTHTRRKGLGKSSGFKSRAQGASATTASAQITRGCTDTDSMEMSMWSETTQPPLIASPSVVSQHSTFNQQVMDQFTQMPTMLSDFSGQGRRQPEQPSATTWHLRLRL